MGSATHTAQLNHLQAACGILKVGDGVITQDRARALSELRRLEADIGEAMRNLKGAQGDEEALRNKAMHLRDQIDRAEIARDKAVATHERAVVVSTVLCSCSDTLHVTAMFAWSIQRQIQLVCSVCCTIKFYRFVSKLCHVYR